MAFGKLSTYFHQRTEPLEFVKKVGVRQGALWEARFRISEKKDLVVRLSDFSAANDREAERRSSFFLVPIGAEVAHGQHEMLSHDLHADSFFHAKRNAPQPAEIPVTHQFAHQLLHAMARVVDPKRAETDSKAFASWSQFIKPFVKRYSRALDAFA